MSFEDIEDAGQLLYVCDDCGEEYTSDDIPEEVGGGPPRPAIEPCEECGSEYYTVKVRAEIKPANEPNE